MNNSFRKFPNYLISFVKPSFFLLTLILLTLAACAKTNTSENKKKKQADNVTDNQTPPKSTQPVKPSAPTVSQSGSTLKISWITQDNLTYKLYRATTQNGKYTELTEVSGSFYTDSGLTADTTYYYKLKACKGPVCSDFSAVASATNTPVAQNVTQQWSRLFGTSARDQANGVSVDSSGNVYVVGDSYGNFDNKSNSGNQDMLLMKVDAAGRKQWSRLLGSADNDSASGVSVDSNGNVYVAGYSDGNFDNKTNSGDQDMFLVKFDVAGSKQWSRLFGTSDLDVATGVSIDSSSNVYVVGYSNGNFDNKTNSGSRDILLIKFDVAGSKQWSRLFGTSSYDMTGGVSIDSSGNVYVVGYSNGNFDNKTNLGRSDMFLVKFDAAGRKQWSRLLGTPASDWATGVSVDSSGNVYVAGHSNGDFDNKTNSGSHDMFLVKFDATGSKQWSRLLGSSKWDTTKGVSVDSSGNAYVTGLSVGNFDGKTNANGSMFLVKFDAAGRKQWSHLFSSSANDWATGVSVDSNSNVYMAGYSKGDLVDQRNFGSYDMLLVKFGK